MTPPADIQTQLDSILLFYQIKNNEILSVYDRRGLFLSMCSCTNQVSDFDIFQRACFRLDQQIGGALRSCINAARFLAVLFLWKNFWSVVPYAPCALSTYGWTLTGLLKVSKHECDISVGLQDVSGSIYFCCLTLKKAWFDDTFTFDTALAPQFHYATLFDRDLFFIYFHSWRITVLSIAS